MTLHERVNLTCNDYCTIFTASNLTFGAHFHNAIELCYIIDGEIEIVIDGVSWRAGKGECIITMPNQVHSVFTPGQSLIKLIRFWPELAGSFLSEHMNQVPECPRFTAGSGIHITAELIEIKNIYTVKGIVYTLLGDLCAQCQSWVKRTPDGSVTQKMLAFIDDNFNRDISLKDAAVDLNYNYGYLSRKFNESVGMSFNDYLNNLRINHACLLLKNTKLSVAEIAYETGFGSIRSFNRNFTKYIGSSPASYRFSFSNDK